MALNLELITRTVEQSLGQADTSTKTVGPSVTPKTRISLDKYRKTCTEVLSKVYSRLEDDDEDGKFASAEDIERYSRAWFFAAPEVIVSFLKEDYTTNEIRTVIGLHGDSNKKDWQDLYSRTKAAFKTQQTVNLFPELQDAVDWEVEVEAGKKVKMQKPLLDMAQTAAFQKDEGPVLLKLRGRGNKKYGKAEFCKLFNISEAQFDDRRSKAQIAYATTFPTRGSAAKAGRINQAPQNVISWMQNLAVADTDDED